MGLSPISLRYLDAGYGGELVVQASRLLEQPGRLHHNTLLPLPGSFAFLGLEQDAAAGRVLGVRRQPPGADWL